MADKLVRVRLDGGFEKNVGAAFAENKGLEVLDEPTHRRDGTALPITRKNGRRAKKKTSVAEKAAEKKAASAESNPADTAKTAEEASK